MPVVGYNSKYDKFGWVVENRKAVNFEIACFNANRPLSNYASVPANKNLKSRLRASKYSKFMTTWHESSTSGCSSRELNRNSKVVYCATKKIRIHFFAL